MDYGRKNCGYENSDNRVMLKGAYLILEELRSGYSRNALYHEINTEKQYTETYDRLTQIPYSPLLLKHCQQISEYHQPEREICQLIGNKLGKYHYEKGCSYGGSCSQSYCLKKIQYTYACKPDEHHGCSARALHY